MSDLEHLNLTGQERLKNRDPDDQDDEEVDPTPWCHACGNSEKGCRCGPIADNN